MRRLSHRSDFKEKPPPGSHLLDLEGHDRHGRARVEAEALEGRVRVGLQLLQGEVALPLNLGVGGALPARRPCRRVRRRESSTSARSPQSGHLIVYS
jgi:hypothetical protein